MSAPIRRGVLALDHGTKRTGFACTDALRITTTPLEAFHGPGDSPALFAALQRVLDERDIDTFLVGWPCNMDGTAGPRATDVERFAAVLAAKFPRHRVLLHDERLTTKAAEERLRELGLRGKDAKARRDSWSALVLLEDWVRSGEPGTKRVSAS
ncbi:MAG: Holliday junction resolvase RuvX [Planctomycetota bacterium]|nr:Holliday junction resolvase RuvX [Planctomycetota bacterium]